MSWPPVDPARTGPLAGVRVLDLSRILAGPFCTMVLGDLGADVLKLERAGVGDETRRWGPPFAPSGDAAYYFACNRDRRSVAVDLHRPAHRDAVLELVASADVLIENFLPGALERLGLTRESLTRANPALVRCTISGYGSDSSRASWPAFDFVIQAHAGILGVTGASPDEPTKAGVPVADLTAGLYAAIGIMAALRTVERTGEGTTVEVALADACASLLVNHAMSYLIGGVQARPLGNAHPSVAPYQTVHAQDRLMAVAAASDVQFARLCRVLERDALVDDGRFRSNAARVRNRVALVELLEAALRSRRAADWVAELNEAGVPSAVVNSVGEALDDPDIRARLVTRIGEGDDAVEQLRLPIWFDGAPVEPHGPPPRLGEHDDLVFGGLREVEVS